MVWVINDVGLRIAIHDKSLASPYRLKFNNKFIPKTAVLADRVGIVKLCWMRGCERKQHLPENLAEKLVRLASNAPFL